jgi:hypothetical protein
LNASLQQGHSILAPGVGYYLITGPEAARNE